MIRSHNLLDNRYVPAASANVARAPRPLSARHVGSTFVRTAPGARPAPPRFVTTHALLTPEQAMIAADALTRAATVAGGAAGMLRGKEIADRFKEHLALAAFLLPRSTGMQRMEGTAGRAAEACYDAAAILTTGVAGAALMHALAQVTPVMQLSQF